VPLGHPHEDRPYRDPLETYDPYPFEWHELRDPSLWIVAVVVVLATIMALAYVFTAPR
jgi:hypothetical protein